MAQATIQTVQEYWDARPCNIRHSDKPVGSREFFGEVEARVTDLSAKSLALASSRAQLFELADR
jgi:hypothetical protein